MKTEKITNHCPKCQAPLPADAPQGLCAKCLLAAVANPTEAGQPAEKDPPPPIATIVAAFPQLEILELIGRGGMGLVYKARQPKLDRVVALKLLPQALAADPAFAERFNREARVLARLNHPNIVTVHDFGQSGPFFFLLMEFVDGVNLRQAMQAGRFTPQQAMLLVPRICEALQFAHDEGILHRDIKPENILLDTRGRVKIADFGIAKLVGEAREQLSLTASGMVVGTPHYMAPEQLEHPHDIDQRADIYSLGVVFYEMLTGELPIGRFAPPSRKTAVDPRVDEVVFHALEKERERRFRTATEVKTSVEAITSTPLPPGGSAAEPRTKPAAAPGTGGFKARAACYFNTPRKMADCFPSAAARVFTSKGELVLEPETLTFISAWRTTIRIPLKDIEDLSVGQFQMWTTPWVMRYARLNFLSVSFRRDGALEVVHLTPVPPEAASANQINSYVGRWFERLQEAIKHCVGRPPHSSDPEWLTISAEPAWNRKGLPLTFGMAAASLAAWVLMPQPGVPMGVWLPVFLLSIGLLIGTLWFCAGFLLANRALWRGDLDAVTSDEPGGAEKGVARGAAPGPGRKRGIRRVSLSWVAVIAAGLAVPVGMLLWEAWVYPSFREKIFGRLFSPVPASRLVMDAVPPQFGPGSRDPREFGGHIWRFSCLVPADHLARVWFVRWSNSVPIVETGYSAYFKTGHAPADIDFFISCEPPIPPSDPAAARMEQLRKPEFAGTNIWWNVSLGLGYTAGSLLPEKVPFACLDTPARMTVLSGHQRVIRLVDHVERNGAKAPRADGVELRILLERLKSPAIRTVVSEKDLGNCIAGPGLDVSMEEALRLMKRLPTDP